VSAFEMDHWRPDSCHTDGLLWFTKPEVAFPVKSSARLKQCDWTGVVEVVKVRALVVLL
jgi:hypothetical protein